MTARRPLLLAGLALLAGCASTAPPVHLLALRGEPDPPSQPPAPSAWALAPRIALPDYLDEAALLTAEGTAGVRRWPATRWAEPLRDALPRVLAADLRRLGVAPPPGPRPRRLTLGIDELLAQPGPAGGLQLRLAAHWRWSEPGVDDRGGRAVILQTCAATPDALADAHRRALWALAQRLVADA